MRLLLLPPCPPFASTLLRRPIQASPCPSVRRYPPARLSLRGLFLTMASPPALASRPHQVWALETTAGSGGLGDPPTRAPASAEFPPPPEQRGLVGDTFQAVLDKVWPLSPFPTPSQVLNPEPWSVTSLEESPSPGKVRKSTALIPETWTLIGGTGETGAELRGGFSMKMTASSCSFRYLVTE